MAKNLTLPKTATGNGSQTFVNELDLNNVLVHSVATVKRQLSGGVKTTDVRHVLRIESAYPASDCGTPCPPLIPSVVKLTWAAPFGADLSEVKAQLHHAIENLVIKDNKLNGFIKNQDVLTVPVA